MKTSSIICALGCIASVLAQKSLLRSSGPPLFFLEDAETGLCFHGDNFKSCGIDTLWYIVGKVGSYQFHKYAEDGEVEYCLSKTSCHLDESPMKLTDCSHCGSKNWNLVGNAETGYAVTENGNNNCLLKTSDNKASLVSCKNGYTQFSMEVVPASDLHLLNSEGTFFVEAASDNDMSSIKDMLKSGVSINAQNWDNSTALTTACLFGHESLVKFLLKSGASIDMFDKTGATALHFAAQGGHAKIIEILIEHGAIVDTQTHSLATPLFLAASSGHISAINELLKHEADPNLVRRDGVSPLLAAVDQSLLAVAEILLKGGANPNIANSEGVSPLISAIDAQNVEMVRLLLEYSPNIDQTTSAGLSPLVLAAASGNFPIAQMLINNGAMINDPSLALQEDGSLPSTRAVTALMYGASGGFEDIVNLLLSKGAWVHPRHEFGGSALLEGCGSGNLTVVKSILDAGASISERDDQNVSCLLSASAQGSLDLVRWLLDTYGSSDINTVSSNGATSLMYAANANHSEVVDMLIKASADVNIVLHAHPDYLAQVRAEQKIKSGDEEEEDRHIEGLTALHSAAESGCLSCVKSLVESGAIIDVWDEEMRTPLTLALEQNAREVAFYLLEHGADPNQPFYANRGEEVRNLLSDAVSLKNVEWSLMLIEKGAEVEGPKIVDEEGNSPLIIAAFHNLKDVVEALLKRGSDIYKVNDQGVTPCLTASSEGHLEILQLLVEWVRQNSSDPNTLISLLNAGDNDGTTALMAAAVRGHLSVVQFLLSQGANVNAQNHDGHTALMFATNGKSQIERVISKYGSYLSDSVSKSSNHEDTNGQANSVASIAPFQRAVEKQDEVLKLLLSYGADENIQDNNGFIARDFRFIEDISPDDNDDANHGGNSASNSNRFEL